MIDTQIGNEVAFMYHNKSFYLGEQKEERFFYPIVTSAFKIFVDSAYFHLNDEEELSMHSEESYAMIRCTAGCGKIYTKLGSFVIKENEYIFLKFHNIIKYKTAAQIWSYRWVNFNIIGSPNFETDKILPSALTDDEERIFDNLLSVGNTTKSRDYINFLFLEYMYSVTENESSADILDDSVSSNRRIDDICSYITQKVFTKITVDTVSSFFNISPRRLHQIFTQELGISPKRFIIKKKMEESYRLLVQTAIPINKIAEMLYFSSPYHFTNEFKRTFSQTPTQVRNMENDAKNKKSAPHKR